MAELKNNSIIDCNKIFEKKSSDVSEQSLLDEINNVLGDAEIFNDFDRKIMNYYWLKHSLNAYM